MNITLKNINKYYSLGKSKIHALKGISMDIKEGDFICLVGPSGCGKTTLLNILGCLDKCDEGDVLYDSVNVETLNDNELSDMRLDNIGFIFQSFNLIPVLNIVENIEFPLIAAGVDKEERKKRINDVINLVGLQEYKNHKPDELSGGQRQRVAIARALVNKPAIVIADEPTANLDSKTGEIILEEMKRLNEESGVTFIFSTHDRDIMKYAKRVVSIKDGIINE